MNTYRGHPVLSHTDLEARSDVFVVRDLDTIRLVEGLKLPPVRNDTLAGEHCIKPHDQPSVREKLRLFGGRAAQQVYSDVLRGEGSTPSREYQEETMHVAILRAGLHPMQGAEEIFPYSVFSLAATARAHSDDFEIPSITTGYCPVTKNRLEGKKVLVYESVFASGGSTDKAVRDLIEAGGLPEIMVVIALGATSEGLSSLVGSFKDLGTQVNFFLGEIYPLGSFDEHTYVVAKEQRSVFGYEGRVLSSPHQTLGDVGDRAWGAK